LSQESKRYLLLLPVLVLLLASLVAGCAINPGYIYQDGAREVGGDGEPIELINNPDATNPTYAKLVAFITGDATDTNTYSPTSYVCSDFAEEVHNNAEAAGIRAAWVSVDFNDNEEGHALNAFETTDKGLVYIDCTGASLQEKLNLMPVPQSASGPGEATMSERDSLPSYDAVAYIEVGKKYGLIDITRARLLSYSFYEEHKLEWQEYKDLINDYNEQVTQYNQEIEGKVYYEGSPELARIEAWEARLKRQEQMIDGLHNELGEFWFDPLGIVADISIHW